MESELLALLQDAKPNRDRLDALIKDLEAAASIDLSGGFRSTARRK